MVNMKEYKIDCPCCKNKIIIKISNDKIIKVIHDDKEIDISQITNIPYEFG